MMVSSVSVKHRQFATLEPLTVIDNSVRVVQLAHLRDRVIRVLVD